MRALSVHSLADVTGSSHVLARPLAEVRDELPDFSQVIDTLLFRAGFNTSLVVAGTTLLGLAAGIIGVFMLLRKRSLMTDALSHATLPGLAGAFLLASVLGLDARSLPLLLAGAACTGVLGVLCVQALLRGTRLREDAAIGTVLSAFFGAGIVMLSYIQKNAPTGAAGLHRFLYGQTAALSAADVTLLAGIAALSVAATLLLLKEFAIVCFNDAFARVNGWPVSILDLGMMALVVIVTVAGLQAVGILLVVAMLIIPSVAARFWTERLWVLIALAGCFGAASGYFGSVTSALLPRQPAGAVIVLTGGVIFVVSMLVAPARGIVPSALQHLRLRIRIAGEHLLEAASETRQPFPASAIDRVAWRRGWSAAFRNVVLWSLRRRRMIAPAPRGTLLLSDAGRERGARIARNHALWEQYLISHADVAPSHVDWSVDQVEHVLSDALVAELEAELNARYRAPALRHGETP